jgi:hypothetical protein
LKKLVDLCKNPEVVAGIELFVGRKWNANLFAKLMVGKLIVCFQLKSTANMTTLIHDLFVSLKFPKKNLNQRQSGDLTQQISYIYET